MPFVKFTTLSSRPSDFESPDGDLSFCQNLISDDGNALTPIPEPKTIAEFSNKWIPKFLHTTPQGLRNFICARTTSDDALQLGWCKENNPADVPHIHYLELDYSGANFHSFGNIIVIACQSGIQYIKWDAQTNNYIHLGNHIPEINVEFALQNVSLNTGIDNTFSCEMADPEGKYASEMARLIGIDNPGRRVHRPKDDSFLKFLSDSVMAGLNKYIAESAEKGIFHQPFFVRYAWRLFDGSNTVASAPVLMIPNSSAPFVHRTSYSTDDGSIKFNNEILWISTKLLYRILDDMNDFKNWKDIITHLDIFISPQIYTFNQSEDLDSVHRTYALPFYFSHCGSFNSDGTRADGGHHRNTGTSSVSSDEENLYYTPSSLNIEVDKSSSIVTNGWGISLRSKQQIEESIESTYLFYRVAEVSLDDLIENYSAEKFSAVKLKPSVLTTLANQPPLKENLYEHHLLGANVSTNYNTRLSIADISLNPFTGFSIRSQMQFTQQEEANQNYQYSKIYVGIRKNGESQHTLLDSRVVANLKLSPFSTDNISVLFPRWLYYPDPDAFEMIIQIPGKYCTLQLKSHDFLNGAYYFRGLGSDIPEFIEGQFSPLPSVSVSLFNRLYTSDPGNPFVFGTTAMTSIGTGKVFGLASAAKPLSQGQFGQFPLYAFSQEGIWALEVASNGSYSSRQPISRDVCTNPKAITPIDAGVVFPSSRGLMLTSGSSVEWLSENFDESFTPHFAAQFVVPMSIIISSDNLQYSLPKFLTDAKIVYSYPLQRLYIFKPYANEAYVYSLRSRCWAAVNSIKFVDSVNSYPECLVAAVDSSAQMDSYLIKDLDSPSEENTKICLLSRPLKLPNGVSPYNSLREVWTRGQFDLAKAINRLCLYASDDLENWFFITGSDDRYINNFSGSPYRYFRIAMFGNLKPNDSILGVEINAVPKLTNRLR